jgi:hypothetical protein
MNHYIRHAFVPIDQVVLAIRSAMEESTETRLQVGEYSVGITSLRLQTFATGCNEGKIVCVGCGLHANFFAVENFKRNTLHAVPHINLYGVNDSGEEVLFTHDHRQARVFGGADNLSNTQVMCFPCNNKKGNEEGQLATQLGITRSKPKKKKKFTG